MWADKSPMDMDGWTNWGKNWPWDMTFSNCGMTRYYLGEWVWADGSCSWTGGAMCQEEGEAWYNR